MELTGRRILITGAGGFVGSRLCEVLTLGYPDVQICAVVRNMGRASRIGRLRIDIVKGDITDKAFVNSFVPEFDVIIHLATGGYGGIVHGTKYLLAAAFRSGVTRFVHMSSAAVYGLKPDLSCVDELAPLHRTGNPYSDAKIKAERTVQTYIKRGLPAVILRPRIVFGPYSPWVTRVIEEARRGKLILVDDGDGACNTVYIDNLVHAILLAVTTDDAPGHTFFITDGEQVTWREFKLALSESVTPNLSTGHVDSEHFLKNGTPTASWLMANVRGFGRFLTSAELRRAIRHVPIFSQGLDAIMDWAYGLPEDKQLRIKERLGLLHRTRPRAAEGVDIPSADQVLRESGKGFAKIDRARRILRYDPIVSFREGLEITKSWLQFDGMLSS